MPRRLALPFAACCLLAAAPFASAEVLTFDDVAGAPGFFASPYRGFQFGAASVAETAFRVDDQPLSDTAGKLVYQARSGSFFVTTDYSLYDNADPAEATQPIRSDTPFVFGGAWFSGQDTIRYQLYDASGRLVFTSAPSATLSATPTFVASGYAGPVASLVIVGHQGYYAFDDFTYQAIAAPVPEPSTAALLVLGLGAAGLATRRVRRSRST